MVSKDLETYALASCNPWSSSKKVAKLVLSSSQSTMLEAVLNLHYTLVSSFRVLSFAIL